MRAGERADPIAKAGLLLVLFRVAGLAVRYLVQTPGPILGRLAMFLPAASAHIGALLIAIAIFGLASRAPVAVPGWRRLMVILACVSFALLMITGQADLTVSTITGAPLTPTMLRTFRGIHVVRSNEFLEPLKANAVLVGGGAALFVIALLWMASLVVRDGRGRGRESFAVSATSIADPANDSRPPLLVIAAGVLLLWLPGRLPWPGPPPPLEVAFAREYLGLDQTRLRGSEQDAIRELRGVIGLPAHAEWVGDQYPLVYRWTGGLPDRRRDPPDIVVVMIESLRAEELAFVTGGADSATPHLDELARGGVVFPVFTSNGFPSAPSVLAFHCSAWPHRRKEIITDFADRRFDCIPSRLRDFGYDTVYVGADPNFDNQDRWLPQWYSTVIDLVAKGIPATDHNIVTRSIEEIRRHDAAPAARPLFEFVSTYSTHYPFRLPADAGETEVPAAEDLTARYRQVLRYTDREVGSLLTFLATRPRRERTVTIVVGDHGFYTDLRRTSGLPENDNVWTAAIVAGPEDLVGRPRRIVEPASHVDMVPTVLALVDDTRPSAALGRNLFGLPRGSGPGAFAVRPGGLRFDRDGYSVLVDARTPNRSVSRIAFPGVMAPRETPPAGLSATRLTEWVNDWSYFIEQNRIWSDALAGR
jgi:hypothetical protein